MKQRGNNLKEDKGGFSRITCEMQKSPAYQSLSASALRVLSWAIYRNYNAATNIAKGDTTGPCFKFTNAEALDKLGMTAPVFSRAKEELADKGFIRWRKHGGLKGVNGVPSYFQLSGDWKEWKPQTKTKRDMSAARAAKAAKKNSGQVNGHYKVAVNDD